MSATIGLKVLTGAIALAIGGTALANTTLDGTSTGDVFINVVDTTNSTSFIYDTGISQAAFSGTTTYTNSFASDPNYAAFKAAEGGSDNLDFSVFSATKPTSASEVVYFSSSITAPTTQTSVNMAGAAANIGGFLVGANSFASTTSNSALLTGSYEFGTALTEGNISATLLNNPNVNAAGGYAVDGALGTSLSFYKDAASRSGVTTNAVAFAGTWTVNALGTYTYNGGGSGPPTVPLPTPIVLLLSGLGLMGVVSRRTKAT
jgi:hypothetical protein